MVQMTVLALLSLGLVAQAYAESPEAHRHMVRGAAAMQMAKSPADYSDAINEFSQATKLAPDFADAWFNLGVAQESAGNYKSAIDSFKTYLEKSPHAADRAKVQDRIMGLEYKLEKVQKSAQEKQAKRANQTALAGKWRIRYWKYPEKRPSIDLNYWGDIESNWTATISISGSSFKAVTRKPGYGSTYIGTISGDRITGSKRDDFSDLGTCPPVQFEGTIYYERNEIVLATQGTYLINNDHSCSYDSTMFFGSLLLVQ